MFVFKQETLRKDEAGSRIQVINMKRLNYFPCLWKTANVIVILEPKKITVLPGTYRPILFFPTMPMGIELLPLTCIRPLLDDTIQENPFGFFGTPDYLPASEGCYLTANATNKYHPILLDLSKAFEKGWHARKLYKLTLPSIPASTEHLINLYVTN